MWIYIYIKTHEIKIYFRIIQLTVSYSCKYIYIYIYTGCNRRNGPDFGRVFLMLNYNEKPQNTYILSWTVWEIMAFENCGLPSGPRTIAVTWDSYLLVGLRVTSPFNIPVWCIVLRTVSISMTRMRGTLQLQLTALCHSQVTLMKSTDINITETTYSCQFQYEFGNQ